MTWREGRYTTRRQIWIESPIGQILWEVKSFGRSSDEMQDPATLYGLLEDTLQNWPLLPQLIIFPYQFQPNFPKLPSEHESLLP